MLLAILITTFQDEMNTIVRLAKEKNKAKFKFVKRLAAKADVRQYFGTDAKKAELPISPTHDSKKNDLTIRSPAQISLSLDTEKLHRKLQAVDPTSNSPISPNMGFRISLIVEQKIVSDRRQLAGEEEANKVSTTDDHNRAPSIIVEHSMTDEVGRVDAADSQNPPSLSPSTSLFSPQQENLNSSLIGRPPPNTPHRSLNRNSNFASNPMSSSLISLQTNFKSFYKILQQFVRGTIFAWFSFLLILGSCIALAFDGPTPENRPKELATIDLFFAIAFTIEVLLNAFTSRLIKGDDPFLKSAWNWLDIFIVIISWITVNSDLLGLKIYRVLRVVRVVKLIKLSKPLRIVTTAIMKTIPMLRTIIIPFLMFLFLASIFGLHVFGGLGWQCNDDSVNGKEDCVGTFIDPATGASTERLWYPYRFYYDNIFHSLLSVLVISFQEGWPNDMYRYMDVTAVDRQPRRDSTPLASAFFVIVEFIGSWFFLAVVTGVIFDNLKHYQEKLKGLQLLTEEQKDRLTNLRFLFVVRPPIPPQIPKNQFHEKFQKVVLNTKFEYGCIAIVCLNIALMAIDHYGAPQALRIFLDISQIIFTAAYVVEIIMLFVGLGYRAFFADKWNIVKILIVISAIIDHVFQFISSANIFVIIRILRIFRIFRSAKGLNALVLGLIINFAQLLNVLFLMVVICFVYAVLGVQYYGKIAYVDGLSSEVNFTTFWNAFYAVYVASTGENWPVIMSNCMVDPPFCDLQAGNCGTKWAPVYFISLQLLMNWILLNSFIAIVVDSFHHMLSNDDIIQTIEQSVDKFNQLWVEYDIRGTQVITIWDFLELYERIEPPLIHLGGRQMHIRVAMSGVPVYNGGNLQYVDVIRSLFIATFAKDLPPSFIRKLRKKGAESNQQRKFIKFLRKGDETERIVEEKPFEVAHATLVIQRLAKAWLEKRKKIREINAGKRNFDKELLKKPNLEEIGVTGPVGVSLKRRESQIGKNEPGLTRRGTRTSLIRPLSMAKNVEEGVSKNEATPGKRKSMLAEQEKSIPIIPDAILEDAVTEKNEQPELQPKAKPDQEMDLPVSSPPLLIQAETVEEELSNSRSEVEVKEPLSSSPLPIHTETIEPEITKKRTEGEETVKEKELERRLSVGIENPVETVDQLLQNENDKTSNSGHV
ncbi:Ion transport protein-domain-containing protein [Paraphysoderma sedebokerense]|nr:Ion transport protein-domain-containing protein [Paraphysoderma sedebokerense]